MTRLGFSNDLREHSRLHGADIARVSVSCGRTSVLLTERGPNIVWNHLSIAKKVLGVLIDQVRSGVDAQVDTRVTYWGHVGVPAQVASAHVLS